MGALESPWNNAVSLLHMSFGSTYLSSGTCFFWKQDERTFLVTNWHNLSGINPLTGANMSKTGGRPDRIHFMAYRRTSEPDDAGIFSLSYEPVEIQLCQPDMSDVQWLEHPDLGRRVDVGAIDVTEVVTPLELKHVNLLETDAVHSFNPGRDVFVIGFPFGAIPGTPAPIWKRGTIALDPAFDPEDLPKIFIDTATREGMSGSVVLVRTVLAGRDYKKKNGTTSQKVIYAQHLNVLGIYSGRLFPDLERAQLGIVWKRDVVEAVVTTGKRAAP